MTLEQLQVSRGIIWHVQANGCLYSILLLTALLLSACSADSVADMATVGPIDTAGPVRSPATAVQPTPTNTPPAAASPDPAATLPPTALPAAVVEAVMQLSPEEQAAVKYAYWLVTTVGDWHKENVSPVAIPLADALMQKNYDAFCQVELADATPLLETLRTRQAPDRLGKAYGYAVLMLQRWQDYRTAVKAFCQSRDMKDLAPAGQAMLEMGTAYQSMHSEFEAYEDEISRRIGLTPPPAGGRQASASVPPVVQAEHTPTPDPFPTPSAALREMMLRDGVERLDKQMGEWMERIASPKLAEVRGNLARGEFDAACHVTHIDVSQILLAMPTPMAALQGLRPAHDAARGTLTAWQDLRKTLQAFCQDPKAGQAESVLADIDNVVTSYRQLQPELERLRSASATREVGSVVARPTATLQVTPVVSATSTLEPVAAAPSALHGPAIALLKYSLRGAPWIELYDLGSPAERTLTFGSAEPR